MSDFTAKAKAAGVKLVPLILGHDEEGVELSLAHLRGGLIELFDDYGAEDPEALAELAVSSARAELKRRKTH
jgi:hypothetical protein